MVEGPAKSAVSLQCPLLASSRGSGLEWFFPTGSSSAAALEANVGVER